MKHPLIKEDLKFCWSNIAFIFVPMGIFYLGLLILLFSFSKYVMDTTFNSLTSISLLLNESLTFNQEQLTSFLKNSFEQFDFNRDFASVIKDLYQTSYIGDTLTGFINIFTGSSQGVNQSIKAEVDSYSQNIKNGMTLVLILLVVFIYLAVFLTKYILRKHNTKRKIWMIAVNYLINSTLIAAMLSLASYLLTLWKFSWFISLIIYLLVLSFSSLLLALFVYGFKKVKFKEVVNINNSLDHFLADALMFVFAGVLILILSLINSILAFLIAIPVIIYISCIISIESEKYVSGLAEEKSNKIKEEN